MQTHRWLLILSLVVLTSGRLAAQAAADPTVLVHDGGLGPDQSLTTGATRVLQPGPGMVTAGYVGPNSSVRYAGGALTLSPNGNYAMVHYGARQATAGLTFQVRMKAAWNSGQSIGANIGFSDSPGTLGSFKRGTLRAEGSSIYPNLVGGIAMSQLSNPADNGIRLASACAFNIGEEIGLAVKYETLGKQTYWIQGGKFASFGCVLGSDRWFQLGETFGNLTGFNVYPFVAVQNSGTCEIHDVLVLSQWNPSQEHHMTDFDFDKIGLHIPSMARDPESGLAILAWNNSAQHVSTDSAIRASVKKSDGNWTTAQTILPTPGGGAINQINSLSVVGNELWLIYFASPTLTDGGILYRRKLTINSEVIVSLGEPVLLSGLETGDNKLNFSPVLTLPSGRLLLPYHNCTAPLTSHIGISNDGGSTWTSVQITPTMPAGTVWLVEPTLILESDGAVGCYMRTSAKVALYSRSTNGGTSWSAPVPVSPIPQPGAGGSRMQTLRLTDGRMLLIGNDDPDFRRKLTVWTIGNRGTVLNKTFIGDFNPSGANPSTILQYPTMLQDGNRLLIAYSLANPGGGTSIHVHNFPIPPPDQILPPPSAKVNAVYGASLTCDAAADRKIILDRTTSNPGLRMIVQASPDLTDGSWLNLAVFDGITPGITAIQNITIAEGTSVAGQGTVVITDGRVPTPPRQFYRLVAAELPPAEPAAFSLTFSNTIPQSLLLKRSVAGSGETLELQASPNLEPDSWTRIAKLTANPAEDELVPGVILQETVSASGQPVLSISDGRTPVADKQFYRLFSSK